MQMALLLRYQTFFLVAFHGVSCRWKRSGSNSFSVQQRLGSASVLWYLLHHRLQPASSLYFTSFIHQPMQPYSNSCMLHFSVFREFHLKWKKWKRFFYFFGTLILPWYHQTPTPLSLATYQQDRGSWMKGMHLDLGGMPQSLNIQPDWPYEWHTSQHTNCFYDVPFKISISSHFNSF